jgi:site-specific DNA recombinase
MPQSAVSILRVSTKKQLNEGEGIENQRRANDEYIRRKGYVMTREIVIAESASLELKERYDLEAALELIFALSKERKADVVVLYKADRLSRGGAGEYFAVKALLTKRGVRVEYATEQIDDSASGELLEHVLAGMARFDNRLRTERTIGAEKILTKQGYWCRAAPTGFRNGRSDGKPVLLPTEGPGQWELLRYGLKKQLGGGFSLSEVAEEMRRKGLRTSRGNPPGDQTWQNICRSPVYGGLLCEEWTDGEFVRAKFDGPLTPEEWRELQRVLDGKRRVSLSAPRQALHPDFPLRRFLLCPGCARPARGYSVRGRGGGLFPYYDCQVAECDFRLGAEEAHTAFTELLHRVTPAEPLLALFRQVVLEAWDDQRKELETARQRSRKSLEALEEEKGRLLTLMKRSASNPALLAELEKDFDRVERELSLERVAGGAAEFERYDKEEVVNACLSCLRRTGELWREWPVEGQSRLQRLVLPEGLPYDVLSGNRTPQLSLVYAAIPDPRNAKPNMAPPTGLEPVTPSLTARCSTIELQGNDACLEQRTGFSGQPLPAPRSSGERSGELQGNDDRKRPKDLPDTADSAGLPAVAFAKAGQAGLYEI